MVGNDIKMFEPAGKKLLIGQYETVDKSRALGMIDEIREAMRAYAAEKGADGIVLCITDIMEEGSQVLLEGETEAAQKGLGIADEHDASGCRASSPVRSRSLPPSCRLLGLVDQTPRRSRTPALRSFFVHAPRRLLDRRARAVEQIMFNLWFRFSATPACLSCRVG